MNVFKGSVPLLASRGKQCDRETLLLRSSGTPRSLVLFTLGIVILAWPAVAAQPAGDLDRRLFEPDAAAERRPTSAAAIPEGDHALLNLARRMQLAQQRIAAGDCGRQTQQGQQEIIADLEGMIAQARSRAPPAGARQQSLTTAGPPAGPPQPKPGEARAGARPGGKPQQGRGAPRGEAERLGPRQLRSVFDRVWGELPEQARQQLLEQWSAEQFLPEYAPMIEEYFRRLSEVEEDKR